MKQSSTAIPSRCRAVAPALILAGTLGLNTCPPALAQTGLGFTKVADKSTAMPGGGGNFGSFSRPVIDGNTVVFWNFNAFQEGIYKYAGGTLSAVANRDTAMPNTTGNFTHFGNPSLAGNHISFTGEWITGGMFSAMAGVYSAGPGGIVGVVDRTVDVPGGGGEKFTSFDPIPSVFDGNTTFYGGSFSYWGVYQGNGGALSLLVGPGTAIPGGSGNFTGTVGSSLEGDTLVFKGIGTGTQQGIYLHSGGSVSRIADKSTLVPGASVNFREFGFATRQGNQTAFLGVGTDNYYGIYRHNGTSLVKVIDRNTPVPSANSGTFSAQVSGPLSGETRVPVDTNGNVVFPGGGAFNGGYFVYTGSTGTIALIMRTGTGRIDGLEVSSVFFSEQAVSGRKIALLAYFSDGGAGVYTVDISSYARNVSGPWDTAANWSFDAVPGPDSSTLLTTGVNVTGPAASATVRSLELLSYVVNPSILSLQNGSTLTATEGALVNFNSILAGSGTLAAGPEESVTILGSPYGRAALSPGHTAVGTININGKLIFGEDSDLRIDLSTAGPCDVVNITGDLDLTSSLGKRLDLVTAPTGPSGSDYTFLTYTGIRTGTFFPVNMPAGYAIDYSTPGQIRLIAPPVTDADHDGITDAWELAQAGNLTTLTATGDADSDGYSDVSEYIADTGALNASQFLQITAFHIEEYIEEPDPDDPDGEPYEEVQVFITWAGRAACHYSIETASSPSGPWVIQSEDITTGDAIANRDFYLSPIPDRLFVRVTATRPDEL